MSPRSSRRPHSALLERLQAFALLLALGSLVAGVPSVVLIADVGAAAEAAASVGILALGASWTLGWRRGEFRPVWEVVEAVALLAVISVAPQAPLLLLGLLFRLLYDRPVGGAVRGTGYLAVLLAGALVAGEPLPASQAIGLTLTTIVVSLMREATISAARYERLLRAVVEQSTDVSAIVGADLRLRWISASVTAPDGAALENAVGTPIRDLVHPDERDGVEPLFAAAAREPGSIRTITVRIPDAAGEPRWVECVIANHLGDPDIEGFLLNLRDRTDERRLERERHDLERERDRVTAERERQDLEARLQRSERLGSVGQLAGGIAHDFNNLLGIILNYAGFIREALPPGAELREDLAEIEAAAQRGAALTRQLLVFSHRSASQPEVVDVNEIVAGIERLLYASLRAGVTLEHDLQANVGATRIDPASLEQALVNLVVNARDAVGASGTIVVRTADTDVDAATAARLELVPGPYVVLSVADDGHGMDAATRERAFEPFFTTKPTGEGTGLGLATVFGVARAAGGTVHIDSSPGAGTTISVYLPASTAGTGAAPAAPADPSQEAAAGERAPAPPAPAPPPAEPAPDRTRVLVAEDEEALRALVERVLEMAGHEVVTAPSGDVALELFERDERGFDVVLSDVVMPGITGLELARRVRRRNPDQPVLLMTAYSEDVVNDGTDGLRLLRKPFAIDALVDEVAAAVDGHAAEIRA